MLLLPSSRMTVRLAVAGAFHTEYMQPAVAKLQEALERTEIKTPRIPVISNVDAKPHSDPAVIKAILAKQVCGQGYSPQSIKRVHPGVLGRSIALWRGES